LLSFLFGIGQKKKSRFVIIFGNRCKALQCASILACDAATWYLNHGNPTHAVELLEQGRAVFWTHALSFQQTFDDLPAVYARKLKTLSNQLRIASASETLMSSSEMLQQRQLQMDWTNTVEEIRKLPGFQYFLCTKPFSQLVKAAKDGPIIILIASSHGCNALLIQPGSTSPHCIPLDDIDYEGAVQLSERWAKALGWFNAQGHGGNSTGQGNVLDGETRRVLVDLWDQVVEPVFDHLKLMVRPQV
jgi:hypothetical protein